MRCLFVCAVVSCITRRRKTKLYLYKGCHCVKLLSKQGSRGCVYSHPHTAIAWVVLLFLSPPPKFSRDIVCQPRVAFRCRAGRFWHELPSSLLSLPINSGGCLLINILVRGNILFSLKSINALCLDFPMPCIESKASAAPAIWLL